MLNRVQKPKLYDLGAVAPVVAWLNFQIVRSLVGASQIIDSQGDALTICSQIANVLFLCLVMVLLVIRRPAVRKAKGLLPRLTGIVGCLLPILVLALPRPNLTPSMTVFSSAIVFLGTAASIFVVYWLGRSFAILPQARSLVTGGPYRVIRHPLYLAELGVMFGCIWEFQQPWPFVVMLIAIGAQIPRMHFEEQVLAEAFPAYREYASRTARLIPCLY